MRAVDRWIFLAVVLVALAFRLPSLGEKGLWIDEDLTRLTVDGVLEDGVPRHPSGGIYLRAPFYSYAAAASAALLGTSEFSLRFPSVLFGILGLWATYRFARDAGGRAVGVAAAVILTFSGWDVYYARMARMYAPTIAFFTLAVWFTYRLSVREDERAGPWMVACGVLATTMHPLAASLVAVFAVGLLMKGPGKHRLLWIAAAIVLVAGVLVAHRELSAWMWNANGPISVPQAVEEAQYRIPGLGGLTLGKAHILLFELTPLAWVGGLAAGAVITAMTVGIRLLDAGSRANRWARLASLTWSITATLNMPLVALLAGAWWVRMTGTDRRNACRRLGAMFVATLAVTGAILIASTLTSGVGDRGVRVYLAEAFGVPETWWLELATACPVMFAVSLAGAVPLFLDSFDADDGREGMFAVGTFFAPLILMGFVESPYVQPRYLVHLNPLFIVLFVMSIERLGRALFSMLPAIRPTVDPRWTTVRRLGLLVLVTLVLADQSSPREAWGAAHLDYGSNRHRVRNPDVFSHFYFDTKTTGEFVAAAAEAGDLVIARDGPATFVYARRVDYVLRKTPYDGVATAKDGRTVDRNIGAPVLDSVERLEEALRLHAGSRIWIVASVPKGDYPIVNLPPGTPEWLEAREDRVVYTGLDGITKVYRFDPGSTSSSTTPSTLPASSLLR